MTPRMQRFLESIDINDIQDFDIDFTIIKKSNLINNGFIFCIEKETPWKYENLDEFMYKITKVTYPVDYNFEYVSEINLNDAYSIAKDFIKSKAGVDVLLNKEESIENAEICINVAKEQLDAVKNILSDLSSLFRFINYSYGIHAETNKPKVVEEKKEPVVSMNEIKEENIKIDAAAQDDALVDMKKNYEKMVIERSQVGIFKKGGYVFTEIKDIDINSGSVDINGFIFEVDIKDTRKGGKIARIGIGDKKSHQGVSVTIISNEKILLKEKFEGDLKPGKNIRIRGKVGIDKFKKDAFVMCHYYDLLPEDELRKDEYPRKRVELHLHTRMSEMDGITSIGDYCKLAKNMGHTAIACTDHGVVQSFPEAQAAAKKYGLKMLYGSELYVIDDFLRVSKNPSDIKLDGETYVCFDLESSGLSIKYDRITEFGAVKIKNGMVIDRLDILINPEMKLRDFIVEKTNISNEMLADKPVIKEVLPEILNFIKDSIIVSHNIEFDYNMLNQAMIDNDFGPLNVPAIDTLALSRYVYPESNSHSLGSLCSRLDVYYDEESAHRADYDAKVLSDCWMILLGRLLKDNDNLLHKDLAELPIDKKMYKHYRGGRHTTVLCKNRAGLKDLYKIISISHVEYMGNIPFVPKSVLEKYRQNLLVGSACFNSELFYSSTNRSMEALRECVKQYDYVEIQPLENYSYLVNMGEIPTQELLVQYVKDIIAVAKEAGKIIVATGDAHYRDPEDKIYRDVYIANQGVGGVNHPLFPYRRKKDQTERHIFFENPDQHYRSTKEMMDAFMWLGEKTAEEYVIDNTNKIADMCETIVPIPDKLFTPTIDNCENLLRDLCYKTAKETYGDIFNTDDEAKIFIRNRLETELDGIISNGYSVIYYIAHKLVRMSNDAGYLVGSRGSVGSSFAATMSGITEVNALPPHYVCPHCHKVIFTHIDGISSGYDLPEKKCPDCRTIMHGDGQNIPFQTFLGFKAEKVPDIDLNFPTDFQATAHGFTKTLLGEDKVYRAGTISTVQFKTAFGYARKYFESLGIDPNTVKGNQMACLAFGCQEVKRTTGQHPGGIVVIPRDYDVYDFTPVQFPAGDVEAAWKTTHFDFHSIHDTILKLDMLGHVDPQALKMMSDLTGIDCRTLPFNDKKVLSLFSSDEALNLQHKYMPVDNGAIGLPEFGTNFVRQMLRETTPKSFSDLLIISGLSHGTNVWTNNAQDLVENHIADLRGVIGCRDDIMGYLMSKGIEGHEAFVIMEIVRKGKKLSDEQITLMKEHDVPDYYIESCKKIKYLFPKGHACAYVMMALRVGYYKVYYPLEFYATFFTLRCEQYDIRAMVGGIDSIHDKLEEYAERRKSNNPELKLSNKEEEIEKTLQVALEMAERGFKFENLDIERSDASSFKVDKEKNALIPPFKVIDGFGVVSAETLCKARAEKPFISQDDLLQRGKISKTNLKDLKELGVLDKLNESNQLSLFDFM